MSELSSVCAHMAAGMLDEELVAIDRHIPADRPPTPLQYAVLREIELRRLRTLNERSTQDGITCGLTMLGKTIVTPRTTHR
jgi:hypothetical protein